MNCKNVRKKFDEFQENLLAPAIKKRVQEHLDSCDLCTRYFSEQLLLLEQCKKVASPGKSPEDWDKMRAALRVGLSAQPRRAPDTPRFLSRIKTILYYPAHRPFRFAYVSFIMMAGIAAILFFAPAHKFLKGNQHGVVNQDGVGENQNVSSPQAFSLAKSRQAFILKKTPSGTPMKPGQLLENGDIIQTSEGGSVAARLDDKTAMFVDARSSVEIRSMSWDDQQYYIAGGEAVFRVSKRCRGQRFTVQTPNARCRVVGTLFKVKVTYDSSARKPLTELTVAQGAVECAAMNKTDVPAIVASGNFMTVLGTIPAPPRVAASKESIYREFDSLTAITAKNVESPLLSGRCLIQSVPTGGSVYINDAFVGATPLTVLLPAGKIKIEIVKKDCAPWSMDDSVRGEKEMRVMARLETKGSGQTEPHSSMKSGHAATKRSRPDMQVMNQCSAADSMVAVAEDLLKGDEDQRALEVVLPLAAHDAPDTAVRIKALNLMQRIYTHQGRFDAAAQVMEKLLTLNIPALRKEMLLFEIASVKASYLKNNGGARRDLQRYLLKYPEGVFAEEASLKYAELSFIDKDYIAAKEAYQNYVTHFPKGAGVTAAADKIAYLCDMIYHDFRCAIAWYQRVIDHDAQSPEAADAYFWQAQCWKKMGDGEKASQGYHEYLSRFPHGRWAGEAMKNIRTNDITSAGSDNKTP